MSILLRYDIKDQPVLIIGAGHVGLRKAKEYRAQGAKLTILSKTFLEECCDIPCIHDAYAPSYLNGYKLVYAATNDLLLNHQITMDCKAMGILCLSATKGEVGSVLSYEDDNVIIGVSTKGRYPAINRIMLERFAQLYEEEYAGKMPYLYVLREKLLSILPARKEAYNLLKKLPVYPVSFLKFLLEAIQKKQACLLVFHGVKIQSVLDGEITSFIEALTQQNSAYAYHFAFLSDMVINTLNQTHMEVLSLEESLSILHACHIEVSLYPMLMQDGRFHIQIKELLQPYQAKLLKLPFDGQREVVQLIDIIEQTYSKPHQDLFIVYHSSTHGAFSKYAAQCKVKKHTRIIQEKQVPLLDSATFTKQITIFSLYMLSGTHMQKDKEALMKQFHDHDITMIQKSCLQEPSLQQLLFHKIQSQTG